MDDAQVVPTKNHPKDDVTLMVPSDVEEFTQYFQFRHRTNNQPVTFDEDAVIITEKLSERQNLRVGDTITLENGDGVQASLTITDICENYVYHYVYLSPSTYEKAFGSAPANNAVLCMLPEDENEGTEDALTTDLLKCRDVSGPSLPPSFPGALTTPSKVSTILWWCLSFPLGRWPLWCSTI